MRNPAVSILLAIFLLGSVSLLFVAKNANNGLDEDLKVTKSDLHSLMKIREHLDDEVNKFKSKSDSLALKNGALEKSLNQTNKNFLHEMVRFGEPKKQSTK